MGDGINDALALRTADVSISLKGATAIAENAASILLMDGGLRHLPTLFELAASNERNLKRSTNISTVAGLGCMAGVFFFGLSAGTAMAVFGGAVAGCMVNATLPLLRRPHRSPFNGADESAGEVCETAPVLAQWAEALPPTEIRRLPGAKTFH